MLQHGTWKTPMSHGICQNASPSALIKKNFQSHEGYHFLQRVSISKTFLEVS